MPERTAFHKRRLRLSGSIEALIAEFAQHCPGFYDDLLLVDSTPVECTRSRETVKRGGYSSLGDALANAADYGYCASHSRHFWGFRLHALFALDGTPRALVLTSPKIDEKLVCVQMIARCERQPGQMLVVIGDKNFRGKDFEAELATLDARIMRPRRKESPERRQQVKRIDAVTREAESLKRELRDLIREQRPELLEETGCGPLTAAILIGQTAGAERFKSDALFARLAGVAPVPVSSGRHDRHRLDRGGNRQINRALHVIAITRGRLDPETRAYLQREEAGGKTRRQAMRCLGRHLARRYYRLLSDRSRHRVERQVYPGVR